MKNVRRLLWVAVAVAGVAVFAASRISATEQTTKGPLGSVPHFTLTDQRGTSVSERDLQGSVWVANFVFTRCQSVCPMLTAKFQAFQRKLGPLPGVRFISISVDPEYDTPQVLAEYAQRFQADPQHWQFLTGPLAEIEKTVVQGFKVHRGEPQKSAVDPTLVEIMHGEHFVLVDQAGVIRGYYRSDQEGMQELETDLKQLL